MKNWKKCLALLTAAVMTLSMTACGGDSSYTPSTSKPSATGNSGATTTTTPVGGNEGGFSTVDGNVLEAEGLRYVLIYNPAVYDENDAFGNEKLDTGSFGSQIDVNISRGEDLEDNEDCFIPIEPSNWKNDFLEGAKLEGDRAEPMGIDYKVGNTRNFFVSKDGNTITTQSFKCEYAGQYCYVWNAGNLTKAQVDAIGKSFDQNIYSPLVEMFGKARFVGTAGKVNLLFYTMSDYTLGFFRPADLLTTEEAKQLCGTSDGFNVNHAVLHLNATYAGEENMSATMAHEFQHLLNFSASCETMDLAMMNTWINEGMSGYIEEKLYPGTKEADGHYDAFNTSERIRNGQSLYNFDTDTTMFSFDIGVYGSVFYFAKYLEKKAGEEIFSEIYDYWRTSYSDTLSTAEALANAVPDSFKNSINQSVSYPSAVEFNNDDEEFMSKLTLQFYIASLANSDGVQAFETIDHQSILFDSVAGSELEGGGRVIVALSGNSFTPPEDADEGLVYIGLDENFTPVTGILCK